MNDRVSSIDRNAKQAVVTFSDTPIRHASHGVRALLAEMYSRLAALARGGALQRAHGTPTREGRPGCDRRANAARTRKPATLVSSVTNRREDSTTRVRCVGTHPSGRGARDPCCRAHRAHRAHRKAASTAGRLITTRRPRCTTCGPTQKPSVKAPGKASCGGKRRDQWPRLPPARPVPRPATPCREGRIAPRRNRRR